MQEAIRVLLDGVASDKQKQDKAIRDLLCAVVAERRKRDAAMSALLDNAKQFAERYAHRNSLRYKNKE